jgi:hypothetical protein
MGAKVMRMSKPVDLVEVINKFLDHIEEVSKGFKADPADSDYQRGYLAAYMNAYEEFLRCYGRDDIKKEEK